MDHARLPTTARGVVFELLGDGESGTAMSERRYLRARELIKSGVKMSVVESAVGRINAAAWLHKHPNNITDEEVDKLLQARPWEGDEDA